MGNEIKYGDSMRQDNYPTIEQVLNEFILNRLSSKLNTAMPAVIDKVEIDYPRVSVIPTVSKKYIDGEVIEYKPIENVPLMIPRTQNAVIHFPVSKGDTVLLIICQRSLDKWLKDGLISPPSDRKQFDITDAIAILGLFPFTTKTGLVDNDLIVKYNNSTVTLKENGDVEIQCDGDIKIGNSNLRRLINEDFQSIFNNHVHNISVAGTPGAPTGTSSSPSAIGGTSPVAVAPVPGPIVNLFADATGNNELTSQTTVG